MKKNEPIAPAESIICLSRRLESIANKYVFQPMGLSSISMKILKLVRRHGPLTASDMLDDLGATKSNISQRMNFLEKAGYIARKYGADKKDRRKIKIELTPKGKKTITELEKRFKKAQISFEEKFTQKELIDHRDFIKKINTILDEEKDNLEKIFKI